LERRRRDESREDRGEERRERGTRDKKSPRVAADTKEKEKKSPPNSQIKPLPLITPSFSF
jgi:hypothetical protein